MPFLFLACIDLSAQCESGRYVDSLFTVQVTPEIKFGQNMQLDNETGELAPMDLYLDLYMPENDPLAERPLMILAFGGSFIVGNRDDYYMVNLCRHFATLGYVTASIDYRVTAELLSTPSDTVAFQAVTKGTHDMRAAVRYFHKEAGNLGIDPEQIYVGGVSAGAFAAIHSAYLDEESEVPSLLEPYMEEWGGLEGNSGNPDYPSTVAGVINLSGAIGDPAWMEEGDVPIVSMHGTADDVVPYGQGLITLFDINAEVYGSSVIQERATEVGIISDFYTWEGEGHTPFVNVPPLFINEDHLEHYATTIAFVGEFMKELVCTEAVAAEEIEQLNLQVYPNPTTGQVFVDYSGDMDLVASVSDLSGKLLYRIPVLNKKVDLPGALTAGIYLLELSNEEGQLRLEKLVVQ